MSENPTSATFVLGRRSSQRLEDAHPDLRAVVAVAIQLSSVDFTVIETLRTEQRQRHMVRQGKSQTKNSRHLPRVPKNAPELGAIAHAVDLGAWVNNTVSWDWQYYFAIADAMKTAAEALRVRIRWGGGWDYLDHYDNAEQAYYAYIQRKKDADEKPFPDGPHFELCWEAYPV